MSRDLTTLCIIGMLICPISIPIFFIIYFLDEKEVWQHPAATFAGAGVLSLLIAYIFDFKLTAYLYISWFFKNFTFDIMSLDCPYGAWRLLVTDPWTIGFILLLYAFCFGVSGFNAGEQAVRREKVKESKKKRKGKFPLDVDVNSLTLGTTGSGKTVLLNKTMETVLDKYQKKYNGDRKQIRENADFICVIDGKGAGPSDEYGIFNTLRHLGIKYKRPFVVVNATSNDKLPANVMKYNPFYGLETQEVKEMVSALMFPSDVQTNAGAEYYKNIFESWLLTVIELMQQVGEYISLPNISKLLDKENLLAWMDQHQNEITAEQRNNVNKQITGSWNDVRSSVIKLQTFMKGMGGQIFAGSTSENPFNVREAYKHNFLTLFLLSELACPEFIAGIGRVITLDCRILINNRINGTCDKNKRVRLFLDEFSAVANSQLLSILSRARSSNTQLQLFTQSVSDLEDISKEFMNQCFDNITLYYIFRQNSAESAQKLADIVGTEISSNFTQVSSNSYATGFGTSRVTREYRIHPDDIKLLKNNHYIRYDKQNPDKLCYCKNEFVNMDD